MAAHISDILASILHNGRKWQSVVHLCIYVYGQYAYCEYVNGQNELRYTVSGFYIHTVFVKRNKLILFIFVGFGVKKIQNTTRAEYNITFREESLTLLVLAFLV